MQVEFRPALRTEFFLETFFAIGHQGKKRGFSHIKGLFFRIFKFSSICSTLMNEFRGLQIIVGPPIFMQNFIAIVIGGLAKAIGYKGYIPYD